MPKRKYASGEELRLYAESICRKYDLFQRAMFQSKTESMSFDDDKQEWKVRISQTPKGLHSTSINISADFVILASGLLDRAKIPLATGAEEFKGDMFHTARWHYDITGGSSDDPKMGKLKDKRVGIIGTGELRRLRFKSFADLCAGATAIQVVPRLAEWSKELFVFQRTPSAVAFRGNRDTDPSTWKNEIASKPGWQRERNLNYFQFVGNADPKPKADLVRDGWTSMPSFSALIGGPSYNVTPENSADHVSRMYALDYPVQERTRKRARDIVKDQDTAAKLQAWYAGWCKRPCVSMKTRVLGS